MQHFIGIDVSKKDFFACFNEQDEAIKFNNDKQGINKFIKHLDKNNYQNSATQIGVESTGAYHLPLSLLCSQGGYSIKVINPLITKKQNQTSLRRVKNDKKDSRLIRYCLTAGAGYEFHETNESLILKNLVRQRNYLSDLRVNLKIKQQDIEYKEKYLEAKITPINQELSLILEEKIKLNPGEKIEKIKVSDQDAADWIKTLVAAGFSNAEIDQIMSHLNDTYKGKMTESKIEMELRKIRAQLKQIRGFDMDEEEIDQFKKGIASRFKEKSN